ncbi:CLUMA_CG015798, isoform B [Clunio marinus]|uniref:CLUMA_CG015798, isoform B n=1 Tax=Clunio marinus TaxID=568069 RepID=A0A1J1ISP2_9DIPT|nr:CLUMA_CG015798, isoform B [Clunio marinus]
MDRTDYCFGRIDPFDNRTPYRCALKERGIAPGYALLADLQNTVPGAHLTPVNGTANGTSGYGCLKGVRRKEPQNGSAYENGNFNNNRQTSTSPTFNSLPRTSTPQNKALYSNGTGSATSGNLSELDSLLQDLSNARYGGGIEKKHVNHSHASVPMNGQPNPGLSQDIIDQIQRPSVDSLLDELSNARSVSPVYAVPHDGADGKPKAGRHVTITVKETTTERVSGTPSQSRSQSSLSQTSPALHNASTATKELDDLMASLSDFKINPSQQQQQQQSVTDYVKPTKGVTHYQVSEDTIVETTFDKGEPRRDQLEFMLGNLQADMSRQGVNTMQKGCCSACDKPIVGQVITALAKTWHPEHFTCNHCNQELGTRNFFERDGNPYCEADYHNLFSPRCAYCNGPILDKCVTALDKTWHTEHFFCAQCGQQFGDDGFHERDGKPYCRNDYFDMFAPKCAGCNRAIMENYISALNSQFHPDCFVCRDCRQPFYGGSFFDHEGMPYCETHYHAKRGSLCAGCSKPITGRCITAMFKKFHPEHFVCAFCLKQLNKGTFKEQNDKPYCHQCFDKLFG